MNELLPFQFNCQDEPKWMVEIFDQIEEKSKEIDLKEFISNVNETNWELLRDMIIFNYWNYFKYYKSEYKGYRIYYYVWSAIEHFYFDYKLIDFMEETEL